MLVTSTPGSQHKKNENKRTIASLQARESVLYQYWCPFFFFCVPLFFFLSVLPALSASFSLSLSASCLPLHCPPFAPPFFVLFFLSYLCLLGKERSTQPGSISLHLG